MSRTFYTFRRTFDDGLKAGMTDAQYHAASDDSCSIAEAYVRMGRISNPTGAACEYARVHGIGSRIGGPTKGDAPAIAERRKAH